MPVLLRWLLEQVLQQKTQKTNVMMLTESLTNIVQSFAGAEVCLEKAEDKVVELNMSFGG